MKISILITNYNKEKYVEECILSALNQDYKNLEIIVFDNNSSDNSLKIINKFSEKIILRKKNRISESGPFNQIDLIIESFKISTGDIICLLDGDDLFLPTKVSHIRNTFFKNSNLDVIFDIPNIFVNNEFVPLKIKKKYNSKIWPTTIPTSGISFKRVFFENCLEHNLFNNHPTLEIDFRLNFFAQKILKNFLIVAENLSTYRKVNDGVMSKIKKFSHTWWLKRLEAHYFINNCYKRSEFSYKENYDFYLTKSIVWLLNKIIK